MRRLHRFLAYFITAVSVLSGASLGTPTAHAQEFLCDVSINFQQLSGAGFTHLAELEELMEEYLNNNTWTDDRFLEEERIDCSLQVIFQEALTQTSFRAQLTLTSRRPIYGTEQNSIIMQIRDNEWQFEYSQGSPLIFEIERFSALTSVLDFYTYIMLGYDYDTFSELGGEPHFQKARRILELAQSRSAIGWDALGGDRSRAELINQLLDPRFQPLRLAYFQYHFDALDHFITDTENARLAVLEVLNSMQELYDELSRQYTLDLFFSAKYQELTAIFKQSSYSSQAYSLLAEVDPSHLTAYNGLVQ